MKWPDGKRYYSLNQYYREVFGEKTYKLALDIGSTCPNRDGTLSHKGCIYCSESGSGDNAIGLRSDIRDQVAEAISLVRGKYDGDSFIAYLQSYTNTYGDTDKLLALYKEILANPRIKGLSIGTRPDCLEDDLLDGLADLQSLRPIWVELGLQTIYQESAVFSNRCDVSAILQQAIRRLASRRIPTVAHLIAGLPGESEEDFLESVRYINSKGLSGIKLHMLHVLRDTELGHLYEMEPFPLPTMEGYCKTICKSIEILSPDIVLHRLNGDPPADLLIAPQWTKDKRATLNLINKMLKQNDSWQGKYYQEATNDRK